MLKWTECLVSVAVTVALVSSLTAQGFCTALKFMDKVGVPVQVVLEASGSKSLSSLPLDYEGCLRVLSTC